MVGAWLRFWILDVTFLNFDDFDDFLIKKITLMILNQICCDSTSYYYRLSLNLSCINYFLLWFLLI